MTEQQPPVPSLPEGTPDRGRERPDGSPQPSSGASRQPADDKGETLFAPEKQPGRNPNQPGEDPSR